VFQDETKAAVPLAEGESLILEPAIGFTTLDGRQTYYVRKRVRRSADTSSGVPVYDADGSPMTWDLTVDGYNKTQATVQEEERQKHLDELAAYEASVARGEALNAGGYKTLTEQDRLDMEEANRARLNKSGRLRDRVRAEQYKLDDRLNADPGIGNIRPGPM
jgi:hypothetical protein